MLKRKANLWIQENEDPCTSQLELGKRKIYRARRPVRPAPSENTKFKITTNLLSKEEEDHLLHPSHNRTRSFNPFISLNFSSYSLLEPFKEFSLCDKTELDVFLSSKNQLKNSLKYSTECFIYNEDHHKKATLEIIEEEDKAYLCLKSFENQLKGRIWKDSYCREILLIDKVLINIVLDPQFSVKVLVPELSKHLFLNCFLEARSKIFY